MLGFLLIIFYDKQQPIQYDLIKRKSYDMVIHLVLEFISYPSIY